eukprot:scaffold27964_cov64-Phaeocystis_antarctica.AAC.2
MRGASGSRRPSPTRASSSSSASSTRQDACKLRVHAKILTLPRYRLRVGAEVAELSGSVRLSIRGLPRLLYRVTAGRRGGGGAKQARSSPVADLASQGPGRAEIPMFNTITKARYPQKGMGHKCRSGRSKPRSTATECACSGAAATN